MSVSQEHYSCRLMRGMLMKTFRVLCQCLRNTTPVRLMRGMLAPSPAEVDGQVIVLRHDSSFSIMADN